MTTTTDNNWYTPLKDIEPLVNKLRKKFERHITKSVEWRVNQLKQVKLMFEENKQELEQASFNDLRSNAAMQALEIQSVIFDCDYALQNLHDWMKIRDVSNPFLMTSPSTAKIIREPYGVVCIISPWNYPLLLSIRPMLGAIASGNCVILKPSEVSSNCAKVMARLIPLYLDINAVAVVNGGVEETTKLLNQKFDYIMYTGNSTVGRIIMKRAAENLTPVTLELGGKSPLYIDHTVDWDVVISRLVWAKFINCGQTCVAPDYILMAASVDKNHLIEHLRAKIQQFYGSDCRLSKDYGRMINARHTQRVASLIQEVNGHVIYGGDDIDLGESYIEPTIVFDPPLNSKLMEDEIFGPVLPIIPIEDHHAAIEFINKRHKPLALYIFSNDESVQSDIINLTSSGAVAVNDCMAQVCSPFLAIGGVGESGMGSWGGKFSFETFTHAKSVLIKPTAMDLDIRYPPYTEEKIDLFKRSFSLYNSFRGVLNAVGTIGSYYLGQSRKQ